MSNFVWAQLFFNHARGFLLMLPIILKTISFLTFSIPLFDMGYLVPYLLRDRKSWRHHLDALRLPLFVSKAEIMAGLIADMDTFGPQYARSRAGICALVSRDMSARGRQYGTELRAVAGRAAFTCSACGLSRICMSGCCFSSFDDAVYGLIPTFVQFNV